MPRGRPRSNVGDIVARRVRDGERPIDVARKMKLSRQRVSELLAREGVDGRALADVRGSRLRRPVLRAWQQNPDRQAVAKKLGVTVHEVVKALSFFRRRGVKLANARRPAPKSKAIERLLKRNMTVAQVAARTGAAESTVYWVRRKLRAQRQLFQ
jgi:DNA-binding CsgD family transcriptional regulator